MYDLRQPEARLLSGLAYAPLRADFQLVSAASPAPPSQVLLCLGGADPRQLTQATAAVLLALPGVAHVHAVVGSAYTAWEALRAWAVAQGPRLTLHRARAGQLTRRPSCGAAGRRCSPQHHQLRVLRSGRRPAADLAHSQQPARPRPLARRGPGPALPRRAQRAHRSRGPAHCGANAAGPAPAFRRTAPQRLRQEFAVSWCRPAPLRSAPSASRRLGPAAGLDQRPCYLAASRSTLPPCRWPATSLAQPARSP
ncbi:MAG: hypothetical protein WKG07_43255 [Hymenobacter sp.]